MRQVDKLKSLPENAILVVLDIVALYTNIPPDEAAECVRASLEERPVKEIPTHFLTRMLEIILKYNIFEFGETTWMQDIGVSMGTPPAPSIANIFMARNVDDVIREILKRYNQGSTLIFMKRFLDDIFMVFKGTTKELHDFFHEINQIHPDIKLTMSHTTPNTIKYETNPCDCEEKESVPFLDTKCRIKDNKISTDLYKKPTDKNQYLLTSSCHPAENVTNIPYSLALRITRICSEVSERDQAYQELKEMLLHR